MKNPTNEDLEWAKQGLMKYVQLMSASVNHHWNLEADCVALNKYNDTPDFLDREKFEDECCDIFGLRSKSIKILQINLRLLAFEAKPSYNCLEKN